MYFLPGLVLGNRYTSHLYSLEPYIIMSGLSVKQNLVFFLAAVCRELSQFDSACMCTQTLLAFDDPYPSVYVGVVNFILIF